MIHNIRGKCVGNGRNPWRARHRFTGLKHRHSVDLHYNLSPTVSWLKCPSSRSTVTESDCWLWFQWKLAKNTLPLKKIEYDFAKGMAKLGLDMTKTCAQMARSGKRSSVAYEGTSSGFEEVPQVTATFKIKMIIKTELYLIQNTRVFFLSCWIFWHFPGTHHVKVCSHEFLFTFTLFPMKTPSMTI